MLLRKNSERVTDEYGEQMDLRKEMRFLNIYFHINICILARQDTLNIFPFRETMLILHDLKYVIRIQSLVD